MTPPSAAPAAPAPAGHRPRPVRGRSGAAPAVPRRVSGPARPRAVGAGAAVAPAVPVAPRPVAPPALGVRALRRVAALPEGRLGPVLDRLLTGRAWIGLVAFALIGIVFMQVSLLRLNAGVGRAIERASALDRQVAALGALDSRLSATERIQAEARRLGLVLPPAGAVTFLEPGGGRAGGQGVGQPAGCVRTGLTASGCAGAGGASRLTGAPTQGSNAAAGGHSGSAPTYGAGAMTHSTSPASTNRSAGATTQGSSAATTSRWRSASASSSRSASTTSSSASRGWGSSGASTGRSATGR